MAVMHDLPPFTELRAFEAAARHLSFKKAAAELSVTPTAISHQIKLLEQHCGRLLFRRRPRPLKLTSAGEQLFPSSAMASEAFADVLTSVRLARDRRTTAHYGNQCVRGTMARAAPAELARRTSAPEARYTLQVRMLLLDLAASEADLADPLCAQAAAGGHSIELTRDIFPARSASPKLVGDRVKSLSPADLANSLSSRSNGHPPNRPTDWQRWQTMARRRLKRVPDLARLPSFGISPRAARHRSGDLGSGRRDLQRRSRSTGACKRRTRAGIETHTARLPVLPPPPGRAPEDCVDQRIHHLGVFNCRVRSGSNVVLSATNFAT